ncbi:MAG: hypothetical protein F2884_04015 [Actinobacteria bacterium]|uniref:Unannotated protein n=1 Tax=freshwater metagenome TaxID=449393 RepID=A0A6J7P280_9ZZZZ|nr:hypothetical protein [Actinomycetota bacterium]
MKRFATILASTVLVLALAVSSTSASTAPKPGASCSRAGATKIVKGLKYTCVKKGKNSTWGAGVANNTSNSQTTTTTTTIPQDSLSYKGTMIYGLKDGVLTRKADSGKYFETDSRSASAFSTIRQKAFSELSLKSADTSHPNIEFIYDIRPSFPAALVAHSKRELDAAAALWNSYFNTKIKIYVSLVTEQDREYIKSNQWLQQNLPGSFSRFDAKSERPFITGGGGYWETNSEWTGKIYLGTASYLDLTYINFEWPQVARHEFFHVVQDYAMFKNRRSRPSSQSDYNKLQPQHFREGGANAISYITSFKNQGWSADSIDWLVYARRRSNQSWLPLTNTDEVIKMMIATEQSEPNQAFEMSYAIGAVMYEWLIGTYGLDGFKKLLDQLATAPTFDVALQNSIGLTQTAFYEKSAPYVFSVFEATKP